VKYSEKIMNCILKMPVRVYFEFLRICELTSREYAVLKSSHVEPILPGDYNVETLCDVNDADLLLDRAKQLCPQTIPYIERALASVRLLRSYSEGSYFVSTTTSTQDSGLLDVLVPLFEKQTGYHVKTVSLGTGRALALAAKGEADVALVHAPSLEKQYVAERKLLNRRLVMYNDFVIIGPKDDPAKVRSATSASGGLKAIEQAKANFVSRGDNSGTHVLEKSLWKAAGIEPKGTWYIETRQGMGATLGIANERNAYTITDRGTYLALRNRVNLPILVEGDRALLNIYSVMEVNPANGTRINSVVGKAFADFMVAPETQNVIRNFGVEKFGQSLFVPVAGKKEKELGSVRSN
jgi:tungstate transport system substrate-binding protein